MDGGARLNSNQDGYRLTGPPPIPGHPCVYLDPSEPLARAVDEVQSKRKHEDAEGEP